MSVNRFARMFIFIGVLALPFIASWSHAEEFPYPKVDYSADVVMQMRQGPGATPITMKMKIYYSNGKQRNEMHQGGHRTVVITDFKTDNSILLMEEQQSYMEVSSSNQRQETPEQLMRQGKMKLTKVGSETVNGVKTIKYKIESRDENGGSFRGHYWLTTDNVPVRIDGEIDDAGEQSHMTMDYKNIKIGKQDPALFTIPAGYKKLGSPMMPGMGMPEGMTRGNADQMEKQLEEMMKQMQKKSEGQ